MNNREKKLTVIDKEYLLSMAERPFSLSINKSEVDVQAINIANDIWENSNFGIIDKNDEKSILMILHKKYPNWLDMILSGNIMFNLKIPENNYDYLNGYYWADLELNLPENNIIFKCLDSKFKISIRTYNQINVKIIYNTQDNFNKELATILADDKIKILSRDITEYAKNLDYQLKNIIPNLDYNNKIIWLFNIIEHLKTYLRDFIYTIDLIKVQLQLKKIYLWIANMENTIEDLRQNVIEYKNNLIKINDNNDNFILVSCNNYGFLTSGLLGVSAIFTMFFPPIATVIGAISAIGAGASGMIASWCGLAVQEYV